MGNYVWFLPSSDFYSSKSSFSKASSKTIVRVSNSLDPDQARQNVGPDLGRNRLNSLSVDETSR